MQFGNPNGLSFSLEWSSPDNLRTAADATRGRLIAHVGERMAWGRVVNRRDVGFEWTWVELVEHLAWCWPYLEHEQADPLGLDCEPHLLRGEAEFRWNQLPEHLVAVEEEELHRFLETHDLSRALGGAFPTPIWLLREGRQMRLDCDGFRIREPLADTLATLTGIGDAICARLDLVADARARTAHERWACRHSVSQEAFRVVATGLPAAVVEAIFLGSENPQVEDEFLAAARMSGRKVPLDDMRALIGQIGALPHTWTGPIDECAEHAAEVLAAEGARKPYEQGYAVARWFREWRQLSDETVFDLAGLLSEWKVELVDVRLISREIDAVSCWSAKHGPGIVVNKNGPHARSYGRRATLAHEVGHLLMDRQGALPLVEVLGGRVSRDVEARARAFAAELLLPSSVASRVLDDPNVASAVEATVATYKVSREVVAWQVRNCGRDLDPNTESYLRSLVSRPRLF